MTAVAAVLLYLPLPVPVSVPMSKPFAKPAPIVNKSACVHQMDLPFSSHNLLKAIHHTSVALSWLLDTRLQLDSSLDNVQRVHDQNLRKRLDYLVYRISHLKVFYLGNTSHRT